jgi:hypothetical protein
VPPDVAVVVQLADRDPQAGRRIRSDDAVDGQGQQFAAPDGGAGEQFADQPGQRVHSGGRRAARAALGESTVYSVAVSKSRRIATRRIARIFFLPFGGSVDRSTPYRHTRYERSV